MTTLLFAYPFFLLGISLDFCGDSFYLGCYLYSSKFAIFIFHMYTFLVYFLVIAERSRSVFIFSDSSHVVLTSFIPLCGQMYRVKTSFHNCFSFIYRFMFIISVEMKVKLPFLKELSWCNSAEGKPDYFRIICRSQEPRRQHKIVLIRYKSLLKSATLHWLCSVTLYSIEWL